jgi:hypothetical protein
MLLTNKNTYVYIGERILKHDIAACNACRINWSSSSSSILTTGTKIMNMWARDIHWHLIHMTCC